MQQLFAVDNETDHDLLCLKTNSCQNVSNKPFMRRFIIRCNIMIRHPFFDNNKQLLIDRCLNTAMGRVYNNMRVTGIKSCDYLSVFAQSHRKLCLIAIIIWMLHANNRMHHIIFHMSHTAQQIPNLILLESQLPFIG